MTVLALILVACGGSAPSTVASAPPASSDAPSHATTADGPFRLTFALPRATWMANEGISGQAMLGLVEGSATTVYGSGAGLLAFEFKEVGGTRLIRPVGSGDCVTYSVTADQPIVSAITKSGGYSADQPDAAFYQSFLTDALVRLPAGTWDISAIATFIEAAACGGPTREMRATVRVHITG